VIKKVGVPKAELEAQMIKKITYVPAPKSPDAASRKDTKVAVKTATKPAAKVVDVRKGGGN
jgi:hypothetical protein